MALTPLFFKRVQSHLGESLRRRRRRRLRSNEPKGKRRRLLAQSLEERRVLAAFAVVTAGDAGSGTCSAAECTLRDAVSAANAAAGLDTITFDSSITGTLTTLFGSGGEIEISDSLTITGPGASTLTVNASANDLDSFRVFTVIGSTTDVTLEGLTISGGYDDATGGGAIGFSSDGTLTVRDSVITGNRANNGGAIYSEYAGTISIENSEVSNNTASYGMGGAIHNVSGNTVITGSTINTNTSYANGGAIASPYQGNVTLTNVTMNDNKVTEAGYAGGALYSGEGDVTVTGSTISGNVSEGDGGALYSINGTMQISNTVLQNNVSSYNGGAVFNELGNVSITASTIDGNFSNNGDGGGISSVQGNLTISGSAITNNASVTEGGGVSNVRGKVIIRDSSITGNTGGNGGGLATSTGDITLINSTVSGNTANLRGGGIQTDAAVLRIVNSTIVLNSSLFSGGGIGTLIGFLSDDPDSEIFVHNSIIAQNTAPTSPDLSSPRDPVANLEVLFSLIGDNSDSSLTASATPDANGNLIGETGALIDPELGALGSNGGPVQTHQPIGTGVVIDAGNNALALDFGADGAPGGGDDVALTADGRGGLFTRIATSGVGAATVDQGAIEIQPRPVYFVDTLDDENDGDFSAGDRSLREILALTNADSGFDSILFAGGLTGTITLDAALGALIVLDTVLITGPGADALTIQAADGATHRLLDVTSTGGDVTISSLGFFGGNAGSQDGGAIRSQTTGQLLLRQVEISGSSANRGGAVSASDGTLALANSTIANNSSTSDGGGVFVDGTTTRLDLVNATLSDNSAGGNGGAIATEAGTVRVFSSTIANNSAVGETGGLWVSGAVAQIVAISNSILAANTGASAPDLIDAGSTTLNVNASFIGNNDGTTLTASVVTGSNVAQNSSGSYVGTIGSPLDPVLLALANNGGTVQTLAPDSASLVLDAGSNTARPQDEYDVDNDSNLTEFLPIDARGGQRISTTIDMGAVELPPAPTITWDASADLVFGTAIDGTQLNATSNVPGTFAYTPASGTILDAGDGQILTAVFTPDNTLTSRGATVTVAINILKADPVISWDDPTSIVFGTSLDNTQLSATSNIDGTFAYTPDAGTVLDAGTQTLNVTFSPTDADNYNVASASVTLVVAQATPIVTWDSPADITQGTALGDDQLDATADVVGVFAYTPAAGTILNAGNGQTLTVVFTPDDSSYAEVSASTTINVNADTEFDFGDAPSTYPVTLADDGARHAIGSLTLGATIDSETDGTASANADADGSDEDGVTFLSTLVVPSAGQSAIASASVVASGNGLLDAWIDFNGDGDWDDTGEQIATGLAVTSGANHVSFSVPTTALAGATFARFRLSSAGGLSPRGAASDGEVEDYAVPIEAGNAASAVTVDNDRDQVLIEVQNDVLRVGDASNSDTFYSGGVGEASQVVVNAGVQDNEFVIDATSGLPAILLHGGGGVDQISLPQGDLDFTAGPLQATSVEVVQMNGTSSQNILLDNDSVAAISETGTLTVLGSNGHTLTLADAGDWSIGNPTTVGGQFAIELTHNPSSNTIIASLGAQWQNPIETSDVNGSGDVTAIDALLIVNELGRRAYSSDGNGELDDAGTADPFPGNFYDVDGNGQATALDALRVVNQLARINSGSGEQYPGEGEWASLVDAILSVSSPEQQEERREEIHEVNRLDSADLSLAALNQPNQDSFFLESEQESSSADATDSLMSKLASHGSLPKSFEPLQ